MTDLLFGIGLSTEIGNCIGMTGIPWSMLYIVWQGFPIQITSDHNFDICLLKHSIAAEVWKTWKSEVRRDKKRGGGGMIDFIWLSTKVGNCLMMTGIPRSILHIISQIFDLDYQWPELWHFTQTNEGGGKSLVWRTWKSKVRWDMKHDTWYTLAFESSTKFGNCMMMTGILRSMLCIVWHRFPI